MLIDNQKQFPSSITITYNQNAAIITKITQTTILIIML